MEPSQCKSVSGSLWMCVWVGDSLVPRLPVFFFIITNKFHYSVENGGNKEKLDACNLRKLGAWYLKFWSRDLQH